MEPGMTLSVTSARIASERIRSELYEEGRRILYHLSSAPFSPTDLTAGSETELQAVVMGSPAHVDLAQAIRESRYFSNLIRRTDAGESSPRLRNGILRYLEENREEVWENSWVRFPVRSLDGFARFQLESDLRQDGSNPDSPPRGDHLRFFLSQGGEDLVRLPVSYLLRLAFAEALASASEPSRFSACSQALINCFISDNTSPETLSLWVSRSSTDAPRVAHQCAAETAQRFLLANVLATYANHRFGLKAGGQTVCLYLSPNPPLRQKTLNRLIPDAFYRELFISPCLEWGRGEAKQAYMHLCHQVLSRSSLNAILKLRDAGLLNQNLVVVPNVSSVSLANNGTHVSLGSRVLGEALEAPESGFTASHEKCLGDLAIKIAEHFLPLFPDLYSAAPCRLDFSDFHPEQALGFLPHELDFDHLRMIWRRWRKKARIRCLGQPLTPFGPPWLDRMLSSLLHLQGDLVPDFRLVDYPVCLMSTEQSPGLSGCLDNDLALKQDLEQQGVFDSRMSIYLALRLRRHSQCGYTGFESRYFSLFPSFLKDMRPAVELQALIIALAFKYIRKGEISHAEIPDSPYLESERRQVFFGAALRIPTFYVRRDTRNCFLLRILQRTDGTRTSRRYPKYLRVLQHEYRRALLRTLREDGPELIEAGGYEDTLADLEDRIEGGGAGDQMVTDILDHIGARSAFSVSGEEFNRGAEHFYRTTLRERHLAEGWQELEQDVKRFGHYLVRRSGDLGRDSQYTDTGPASAAGSTEVLLRALGRARPALLQGEPEPEDLKAIIQWFGFIHCLHRELK
jgi:hypothetical protein